MSGEFCRFCRVDTPKFSSSPLGIPELNFGASTLFSEGRTLDGMERSAGKPGDGKPWSPEIKVKGGNSAFYSIGVGKGE